MKKTLKKFSRLFLGKKFNQRYFEFLHRISLKGMNFGESEVEESGEKYVLNYLAKNLPRKAVIFDVGANLGQYARLANKILGQSALIYSFEPAKETFKILNENIKSLSGIQTYNQGFGSIKGMVELFYDNEGSGLASVYKRRLEHSNTNLSKKEEVKIDTIDEFCARNDIRRIDFLKLDVEGHELEALRGASGMLEGGRIHNIQFEFGGTNIDSRTYFQDFYYLLKDKYRIYRVLGNGLREIEEYSEWNEIFVTINYFAKLKS